MHGTDFAESLERRLAPGSDSALRGQVAAIEAAAELQAAIAQGGAQAARLQERFGPLRTALAQRLGLTTEEMESLQRWWREPTATERRIQASLQGRTGRTLAILRETGAQSVAYRLPHGTLLLAYHCGLSTCSLLALHPSGEVRFVLLSSGQAEIAGMISNARAALTYTALPSGTSLRRLSGVLLDPIADWLGTTSDLVVLPDGPLFSFPFAALLLPGTEAPLVSRLSVIYLPSAPYLPFPRRPSSTRGSPLVVGLGRFATQPALRQAEAEARSVAGALGVRPILGSEATRAAVLRRIGEVPVIHLASHAVPDQETPMASSLLLRGPKGRDAMLSGFEVLSLDLQARLVVLSACDTGFPEARTSGTTAEAARIAPTNDPLGLARAFLLAGAGIVVATHWPVDDPATAELMVAFHNAMRADAGVAEALRAAQDALRLKGAPARIWAPYFMLARSL